jgi:hypothetical protein
MLSVRLYVFYVFMGQIIKEVLCHVCEEIVNQLFMKVGFVSTFHACIASTASLILWSQHHVGYRRLCCIRITCFVSQFRMSPLGTRVCHRL